MVAKQTKYDFTPDTEAQICLCGSTVPRFWLQLGQSIDPSRLPSKTAQRILEALRALSVKTPVTSHTAPIQWLRHQVTEGKLKHEDFEKAAAFMETAFDLGLPDPDSLIATILPSVKAVQQKLALEEAFSALGSPDASAVAAEAFTKVESLGKQRQTIGTKADFSAEEIEAAATSTLEDTLPTGILEVDGILSGGLERKALGVIMAGPGDGKSLFLSHVASEALFTGLHVAYITLEISENAVKQRIFANLFGMTPEDLKTHPQRAVKRSQLLKARPEGLGDLVVCYMSPKVTSPGVIRSWLRDIQREWSFTPDVLFVDYADKMTNSTGLFKKRSYEEMSEVYQGLRDICAEDELVKWLWTASQTKAREGRKKKTDLEDVADSMEKMRIADLVLAIQRTEEDCEEDQIRFRLPKRRNAKAHGEAGPLPMDAEHWRIVVTNRSEPW